MAIRNPCGATRRPAPAGPERCGLPRRFAPRNDVVIFGWSFFFPMPLASAGRPGGRPLRIPTNNSDERRGRRPRRPTRPTGAVFPMPSASAGGSMPRPYGVSESRRGDPCGRPERRGRRSLRVSFRSTPPQPVGAIHESPAAAKRRVFRCLWHRGNGTGAVPYDIKNPPFPEKRGISITFCSYLYAERKLATSRAVLLDGFQAKSIRHEFARRGSLQKSPGSEEPGDEAYWVNLPITGSWRSA